MDYPNIEKYLGKDWLKKEIPSMRKGEWIDKNIQKKGLIEVGFLVLGEIDNLIGENAKIHNFEKWTKEAKKSKDFQDCLFELICINRLSKRNKIIIKQKNGNKTPDAFLKDEKIYIEMTNLKEIYNPDSIELKVNNLCQKSEERFGKALGIHFIGINGYFEYDKKKDSMVPKDELSTLVKDLLEKLQKLDKNILCFVLVNNYVKITSNEIIWYRQIPHIIFNKETNFDLVKKIYGDFKILSKQETKTYWNQKRVFLNP